MAKKFQMQKKNSDGTLEIVYPETDSSVVKFGESTVEVEMMALGTIIGEINSVVDKVNGETLEGQRLAKLLENKETIVQNVNAKTGLQYDINSKFSDVANSILEIEGGGTTYPEYDGEFVGNAIIVNGYTVKIKFRTIQGMGVTTKLKINNAPSTNYDTNVENTAISFDDTIIRATFTNVEKVYMWGLSYAITSEETGNYGNVISLPNDYTQATEVEIKEDCTIMLISSVSHTGGGE